MQQIGTLLGGIGAGNITDGGEDADNSYLGQYGTSFDSDAFPIYLHFTEFFKFINFGLFLIQNRSSQWIFRINWFWCSWILFLFPPLKCRFNHTHK